MERIQDKKHTIPTKQMVSLEKLHMAINDTLLAENITYEDVADAVNSTINEESKKAIMDFLYAGNIL